MTQHPQYPGKVTHFDRAFTLFELSIGREANAHKIGNMLLGKIMGKTIAAQAFSDRSKGFNIAIS